MFNLSEFLSEDRILLNLRDRESKLIATHLNEILRQLNDVKLWLFMITFHALIQCYRIKYYSQRNNETP